MKRFLFLLLKGIAMGAANVIPGVSGGTIAFITGIFEEFVDSLKAFDLSALRLALRLQFRELFAHLNLAFLIPLMLGVAISLISLGKLLDWLFSDYPTLVWSFFFGLIVASVYFVSLSIKERSASTILAFTIGTLVAVALAFLKPASENDAFLYLVACGVVAVCSMILPGLSGSFVLILMGNYQLVMLQALPNFDFHIIIPFAIGGAIGFVGFSRVISYLLHHFHDVTMSMLTGFILGSLVIIWPWKNPVFLADELGELLLKDDAPIVQGYEWTLPALDVSTTWISFALIAIGMAMVVLLEKTAARK